MKAIDMKFVRAGDYYKALLKHLPTAKKRIVIHAMTIWWGPATERLVPLLVQAADRGVEVHIVGDLYSKFAARMPQFFRPKSPSWHHIQAVNASLKKKGVHVTYVGPLGPNPFRNRCHSKITLVDDLIYTFGGVNFTDDSFQNHDYMLEMRNQALADRLYRLVTEIEDDPKTPLSDLIEPLGSASTLLFDSGTPGGSVIYQAACDLVVNARKVYFVSQMCPSGKLARLITTTDSACYFIRPAQADTPANIALIVDAFRYHIQNRYTGKRYIHAKFILTEDHDGQRHVLSGSNNFSWRGVAYGTKEIAVHSTDPQLWDAFYAFLQKEIAT